MEERETTPKLTEASMPRRDSALRRSVRSWLVCSGLLGFVCIVFAALNVWLHVQYIQDGYRLANLQAEQEQLLAVQRKLRLEWSQLCNPGYLEQLASEKFGLAAPRQDQKVLIR